MSLLKTLNRLSEEEAISTWVYRTAKALSDRHPEETDDVLALLALCLHAQEQGNLCIKLDELVVSAEAGELEECVKYLDKNRLITLVTESVLVGKPGDFKPLILEDNRLYLHKYWKYETELAEWLNERSQRPHASLNRKFLDELNNEFETDPAGEINWQKVAAQLAFQKDFVIISGGPGTGKTYTVNKILNLFARQGVSSIALCAPTGKAAQRLTENLSGPDHTATTIHKLLGAREDGSFAYGPNRKLPFKVVIVDEASMLDIRLWTQLIRALHQDTRLIVLGDKDQLASVEAGSVLGDMCAHTDNSFSEVLSKELGVPAATGPKPAINDSVVILARSYRFSENSGLKLLADSINSGDAERCIELLKADHLRDIRLLHPSSEHIHQVINDYVVEPYLEYYNVAPELQFRLFKKYQILAANRKGPRGVENLNIQSLQALTNRYGFSRSSAWFQSRAILFTRNDRFLNVKNGETGLYNSSGTGGSVVVEGDATRTILTNRIHNYDSAYAITVHKGQGSEYENVALILPESLNPILTRELLYTAVTRARESILVVGNEEIIKGAVSQKITRVSGLSAKLNF